MVFQGHTRLMRWRSGRVAQLVEQVTFNHWVTGSNPVALTTIRFVENFILQQIGWRLYVFEWTVVDTLQRKINQPCAPNN